MSEQKSVSVTEALQILSGLGPEAIRERLTEMEHERSALLVLLRSALRLEREQTKQARREKPKQEKS